MWTDAVKIMTEETDYVNAETLFDIWSKPPYGIKRGAFPIILMLFILTNKDKLAVYHENIFVTEFDDYFVECLMIWSYFVECRTTWNYFVESRRIWSYVVEYLMI